MMVQPVQTAGLDPRRHYLYMPRDVSVEQLVAEGVWLYTGQPFEHTYWDENKHVALWASLFARADSALAGAWYPAAHDYVCSRA